jgi:LacI family transcriptional regulator
MACFDIVGRQVLEACRQIDAAVPDEVAVVGVDNDELLCELADPPLSSVFPDTQRTGYVAAELLDKLMSGHRVPPKGHFIEPLGVIVRESSDVLAIEDADVSQAVRFIRAHACEGINVHDVLTAGHIPLSRRVLESRFKKLIGRTPHEEIDRVQLNRVKELLRETDLPLTEIARRAGYEHVEYLSVVFKKKVGTPPSQYRRVHRK